MYHVNILSVTVAAVAEAAVLQGDDGRLSPTSCESSLAV